MANVHNGEPKAVERTAEWLEERIDMLKSKKKTLKFDYETRSENVEQEIKDRTVELKSLKSGK